MPACVLLFPFPLLRHTKTQPDTHTVHWMIGDCDTMSWLFSGCGETLEVEKCIGNPTACVDLVNRGENSH